MTSNISDRQLEIIEAAGKILTSSGVSGLTIKNLAKEMQFSESALYRHFNNKEEIIIAMLNFLASNMQALNNASFDKTLLPEEKISVHFKTQFSFFSKNPYFAVAVFSDGLMEESKLINETILNLMEIKRKHLLPILKEGQKNNVFTSEIPAEELLHIIIGAVRLQMYKWRVANFTFNINDKGNKLIQSIITLIKNK